MAKNALKEAQKTIDKALDIQDDDQPVGSNSLSSTVRLSKPISQSVAGSASPGPSSDMKQSISQPTLPVSIWGSFTGSFFDNPNAEDGKTVTTPPSSSSSSTSAVGLAKQQQQQRRLPHSESSGSVEIVSPPTTPGSSLTSPDAISHGNVHGSESSVEVISNLTPTSDLFTMSSSSVSEQLDSNPYADSIEIIADEEFVEDDVSFDEDSRSYNTVTETATDPTTVVSVDLVGTAAITKAPSRSSLHLPLEVSTSTTPLTIRRSVSCSSADMDASDGIARQLEESSVSIEFLDEHAHLSDSTQSFEYVNNNQTLQQEQVDDRQEEETRGGGSPNSSEDIVKISSEPTSGHTSADEVETATSSDIEIISSPNGDSSSTNSACKVSPSMCQLPAGVTSFSLISTVASGGPKKKGHARESSTHSIQSTASDDSRFSYQSETERLMRRISELSEIVGLREYKLMELGRENAELHERNADIQRQLDAKRKRDDCLEVSTVTEEYTQRLSALEKKFQQSIRERDNLREQLKVARNELVGKVSKEDIETELKDREFLINELKTEGEKLSKQILQHSNIIKKLRAAEKMSDSTMKRQKDQLNEYVEETDRLKKSLSAKDEVERSQIEAVHKLSSEKSKLDKEVGLLRSQLDDTEQKWKTVQTSLDAAKRELNDKQHAHKELSRKTEALASLESEKHIAQSQNNQIIVELLSLREKLRQSEGGTSQKELSLRQENGKLLQRLEEAEQKLEQQAQSVTDATIPLVRQLEGLQVTLNVRTANWEVQERQLLEQLENADAQCKRLRNIEHHSIEKEQTLNVKVQQLETRLTAALLKAEQVSGMLQQRTVEFELSEADFKSKLANLKATIEENDKNSERQAQLFSELQAQLDAVLATAECRGQQGFEGTTSLMLDGSVEAAGETVQTTIDSEERNSSPTLSLGRMSMADSLSSALWPLVFRNLAHLIFKNLLLSLFE